LAFVEVSSDGNRYVRFPANSLTDVNMQIPAAGVYMYANLLNNLAGKYIGNYGTPFDLQELVDSPGIDVNNITHVRLIDVVGSVGNHASRDITGRIINDPYPTQLPTGGFDLDAVGALHQVNHTGVATTSETINVSTYPNPATDQLMIAVNGMVPTGLCAALTTISGKELQRCRLLQNTNVMTVAQLPAGMYYLVISDANGSKWVEKVTKR
jgi:fluoride ion exporter CrcB/FEX